MGIFNLLRLKILLHVYYQPFVWLRQHLLLSFLIISFSIFTSCSQNATEEGEKMVVAMPSYDYLYHAPESQPDGWEIGNVSQEELAEELVVRVMADTSLGIEGVLLSREGALVLEEYKPALKADSLLPLGDSQMLLISTLSAVWQNRQERAQPQMVNVPSVVYAGKSTMADTLVSLQHLLRMETDMLCRPQNYAFQDIAEKSHPARFYYCPANYEAVAQWMEDELDGSLSYFAEENLFEPLEIDNYLWEEDKISLPPRDMLKLAALYARKGNWQQQQLFADNWVLQLQEKAYDAKAQGQFAWGWWQHRLVVNGRQYTIFYSKSPYYLLVYVPDVDAGLLLTGQLEGAASDYFPLLREQAIPSLLKK